MIAAASQGMKPRSDFCSPKSKGDVECLRDRSARSNARDSGWADCSSPLSISRRTSSDTSNPLGAGDGLAAAGAAAAALAALAAVAAGILGSAAAGAGVFTIGSAALNTSISSGSADSGSATGTRGIRGRAPFLVSTKIRSSSPGGRVNSNDVSPDASAAGSSAGSSGKSTESLSLQSRICRRAISIPEGAESSGLGCAPREEGGAGDCNMLSARVSNSNELSPVPNALGARRD